MSDPIDTVYQKNNELSNFVIANATTSASGLMSSSDKEKLNGIESGATANPTIPNATTSASGLMSSSDKAKLNGIESGATANPTIPNATTSASGLMSSSDKAKLNGIADSANNYVLPKATGSSIGGIRAWQGLTISNAGYLTIDPPVTTPIDSRFRGSVLPGTGLEMLDNDTGLIGVKLERFINLNEDNGNLGIGLNPSYKLHVKDENNDNDIVAMFEGQGDSIVYIKGNNTGGYDEVGIVIKGNSAKDETWFIGTDDDDSDGTNGGLYFAASQDHNIATDERKIAFTRSGWVGILTSKPMCPLHVAENTETTSLGGGYYIAFNTSSVLHDPDWSNDRIAIYASGTIFASTYVAASDIRIKENIVEVKDETALKKVRDISCCWYNYKNTLERGNKRVIGFIAQQVKEHFPEAVSLTKNIIPNEMRIIENPQWTEINDGSNNKFKLTISDLQDISGVKYRFYVSNDVSGNDEVKKETTGNSDNSFTFDNSYNNVFCYGKEVDDFHTLDKQKLFALNFSATQEIDRIQQRQITELTEAKLKIQLLEEQNSNLLTRLEALEKKINNLS